MAGKFRVISWGSQPHEMESGGKPQGKPDMLPQQLLRVGARRSKGAFLSFRQALKWNALANKEPYRGQGYFGGRYKKYKMLGERIKLLRKAFSEET